MTSAKPQPMAGQTQGPDDLIAELAKLMAEDMRSEKAEKPAAAPFRVPGPTSPVPAESKQSDPLALLEALSRQTSAPVPEARPVRIPGTDAAPAPAPASAAPAAPIPPQASPASGSDFAFNFKLPSEPAVAGPAQPVAAAAQRPAPRASESKDSIADLIAAELSADIDAPPPPQMPAAPVSARPRPENSFAPLPGANPQPPQAPQRIESDAFGVPPVFGLGTADSRQPTAPVPPVLTPGGTTTIRVPSEPEQLQVQSPAVREVSKPAPAADFSADDPLAEIERLVNSAVRLDPFRPTPAAPEPKPVEPAPVPVARTEPRPMEAAIPAVPVAAEPEPKSTPQPVPVPVAATPSPALRSLATPREVVIPPTPPRSEPVLPARSEQKTPTRPAEASVDEAILAAAAATGARIEWVEGEDDAVDKPAPRAGSNRILGMTRSFAGPLVALTLLVAAGLGLYWVLGQTGSPSGEPAPLIAADTTPVKEVPETTTEPAPQSVVFNEISGVDTGSQEQIVSRDQTDIAAIDELTTTTPVSEDEGLVNRKVRTVTVRPDGTIVSGDESLAGAAILPVDRPDVPDVPGANFSTPEMVANVDAAATATVPDIAPATPATPTTPPVTPGSTVQAVDLAGNPLTGRTAPVPFQRPANFATLSANAAAAATAAPATTQTITTDATPLAAPTQPAPAPVETTTTPVAATPTVTTTPTSNAAAYAQLASLRSEADAQAVAQRITTRFGVLFGSSPVEIRRVDLGERGIYYRVVVPADSRQTASNICVNVKAAGGDCVLQ